MKSMLLWIAFEEPKWLWLLATIAPLVLLTWKALRGLDPVQRYAAIITRCIVIIVLVLCIAGIQYVRTNDNLTVLFLLDRSHSIPKELFPEQEQYIHEVAKTAPKEDKVGVIAFDGESQIVQLPMEGGTYFDTLGEPLLPDQTDMSAAMRMAMALFPHDTARRVVLMSDGNSNVGDIISEIRTAKANGIGIDVLPITYLHNREIYVQKLVAPASVKEGDLVPLKAIIVSNRRATGTLTLTHDGVPIELPAELARQSLEPGPNHIIFKVPVHESKPHRFEVAFHPDDERADTLVENNKATTFTFVGGNERVLLLTSDVEDDLALAEALQAEKIQLDVVRIEDTQDLDLIGFMRYASIILSNLGAHWFTDAQLDQLSSYVRDTGGGLIMTGGDDSFGAGGWIGTPIEEIMPVDFEIKHRQVIPRGALVIVMHSCEMPRGNFWGKKVAEKAVETISSKDYFGMLGFSHMRGVVWEVPLQVAINKTAIKQSIQSMNNGDMPDFATTMKLAVDGLMELSDAAQRHIIIISDGDAQPPTQQTINRMKQNKITCSTVGIGYGQHVQEMTLRKIAKDTEGRFYAARNPKNLPQIFIKESKVVRRPLISEQPFIPQLVYALSDLWTGFDYQTALPPLGGLVMTSPKASGLVETVLVRQTEDGEDPVLAHWQVGLGRTVAFTSGYWTHWGEEWTAWAGFGKLWAQIVRWTMSHGQSGNFDLSIRHEGNEARIVVNALDSDSNFLNYQNLYATIIKPEGLGEERVPLAQVGPGLYEAPFAVQHTGQYVVNVAKVQEGTATSVAHTGLAVPYSPEYRELQANLPLLEEIRQISEGRLLTPDVEAADVFRHDLPPTESRRPAWEWVLAWILLPLFLFDVALRRLASIVALSVLVEVLLDCVLLFGVGIIYWPGWHGVWGTLLVLFIGEVVGWTIRFRSIRPTFEFFTHTVVALGGAGQSSAASLEQLRGTRARTRDERTTEGAGVKVKRLKRRPPEEQGERTRRFDVGDERGAEQVGDISSELGGAQSTEQKPAARDQEQKPGDKPPKISDDFTSRLLQARKRAREEMDRGKDKKDDS